MENHPHFDLSLHTTDELSALLAAPVTGASPCTSGRSPASSASPSLAGGSGSTKSRRSRAWSRSSAAAGGRVSRRCCRRTEQSGRAPTRSTAMLFEPVDAPALNDLTLTPAEILCHGKALVAAVQALPADAPLYADLGSLGSAAGVRGRDPVQTRCAARIGQVPRDHPQDGRPPGCLGN